MAQIYHPKKTQVMVDYCWTSWNKVIPCPSCCGMHVSIFLHGLVSTLLIMFWIDLNAPDAVDVLTDELRGTREPKNNDAWSPYESKMVGIDPLSALRPLVIY
jgi:hypothetical protein